jgi:hypothetical protein
MEKESFYKLKGLTSVLFNVDEEMLGRRSNWQEPIGIEMVLHCLLKDHLPTKYGLLVEYHDHLFIVAPSSYFIYSCLQ